MGIDDGLLGDITFGRFRIAHSAALDKWFSGPSAWFADPDRAGGGALFDLGCHPVYRMRWLMGEPKRTVSIMNNFTDNYPIDDNSASIVEFKNNAIGLVDCSWVHRSGPKSDRNLWDGRIDRDRTRRSSIPNTEVI